MNLLLKQQAELIKKAPEGVIYIQNESGEVTDIQADIYGPCHTPYAGGVFRCKLVIDNEFPQKPPKGYFLTRIFHPNVAQPSGDICVNTLKKDWNPQNWSFFHIFEVIKCLLIYPFPESALNAEAGRLFMESFDEFSSQAALYTQVHAQPNQKQQSYIEQLKTEQNQIKTQNNSEKQSSANAISLGAAFNNTQQPSQGFGQSMQFGQQSFGFGSIGFGPSNGVLGLSKVANFSQLPLPGIEQNNQIQPTTLSKETSFGFGSNQNQDQFFGQNQGFGNFSAFGNQSSFGGIKGFGNGENETFGKFGQGFQSSQNQFSFDSMNSQADQLGGGFSGLSNQNGFMSQSLGNLNNESEEKKKGICRI